MEAGCLTWLSHLHTSARPPSTLSPDVGILVLLPSESSQGDTGLVVQNPWCGLEHRTPGVVWPVWSRQGLLPPFPACLPRSVEQRGPVYITLVQRCAGSGAALLGQGAPQLQRLSVTLLLCGQLNIPGALWRLRMSEKFYQKAPLGLPINLNIHMFTVGSESILLLCVTCTFGFFFDSFLSPLNWPLLFWAWCLQYPSSQCFMVDTYGNWPKSLRTPWHKPLR